MEPSTVHLSSRNASVKLGESKDEMKRLSRRWSVGILLFGLAMILISRFLSGRMGDELIAWKTNAALYFFYFGVFGIIMSPALLLIPFASDFNHAVSLELGESGMTTLYFSGKTEYLSYESIASITIAYENPLFCSYDKLVMTIPLEDGQTVKQPCGKCKGEIVEQAAQKIRDRIGMKNGVLPGSAANDRKERKRQTAERMPSTVTWLALFIFLGFWIMNIHRQYEDGSLLRDGVQTVATVTDILEVKNRRTMHYEFADSGGTAHTGSCGFTNWTGRVPKQRDAIDILYSADDPSWNLPEAAFFGAAYLPLHLLMGTLVCIVVFALLRTYALPRPALFRGSFFIARSGELVEEKWERRMAGKR